MGLLIRCSWGIRMYCRKAELCHLPRVWIVESSTPARAADVAAPIRKLCPASSPCGRPRPARMVRTCCTSHDFVTAPPCELMKNGPDRSCRSTMYATTAAMGQMRVPVCPTMTLTPLPNWSHFDRFRWTLTIDGEVLLSIATCCPKKAKLATVQISCFSGCEERTKPS